MNTLSKGDINVKTDTDFGLYESFIIEQASLIVWPLLIVSSINNTFLSFIKFAYSAYLLIDNLNVLPSFKCLI